MDLIYRDLPNSDIFWFLDWGPFIYYVRKIVGGWVQAIAYNCLYTGWVGLKKFLRKIFIHEKNKKSAKFSTNASKLSLKVS